jgi:hypothetical protein
MSNQEWLQSVALGGNIENNQRSPQKVRSPLSLQTQADTSNLDEKSEMQLLIQQAVVEALDTAQRQWLSALAPVLLSMKGEGSSDRGSDAATPRSWSGSGSRPSPANLSEARSAALGTLSDRLRVFESQIGNSKPPTY